MADFERKSAIGVHVTGVMRTKPGIKTPAKSAMATRRKRYYV